jgi:hypothetical protein
MSGVVHMNSEREHSERDTEEDKHLPEWVEIFGQLKEEAEELYPDGRVRVLVPKRKKRAL